MKSNIPQEFPEGAPLKFGDPLSIKFRDSARPAFGRKMTANGPTQSRWRATARNVIRKVIAQHGKGPEVRKLISAAYPFGERKYTPYKIWLEEIRLQCDYFGVSKETSKKLSIDNPPFDSDEVSG